MQDVYKWEFVRGKEGFSLEKANRSLGKIVNADGGLNGAYIGKLEKVKFEDDIWWGVVNIHGVSRYPVEDIHYEMSEWDGRVPFQHAGGFLN